MEWSLKLLEMHYRKPDVRVRSYPDGVLILTEKSVAFDISVIPEHGYFMMKFYQDIVARNTSSKKSDPFSLSLE